METGDVDLALGYLNEFEGPFHRQRLFTETCVCVVRKDHPRISGTLTLDQFFAERHLVYLPSGSGQASMEASIGAEFQRHGVHRVTTARVAHCLGLWELIAESDSVVVLPSRLATAFASLSPLQILPTPMRLPSFDITQHWHERFHQEPANQWLRNRIASLFNVPEHRI